MTGSAAFAARAALSLQGVALSRGGRRVLENVSFDLAPGEAVLLKGANGAGKTTLLRAAAGLAPADEGAFSPARAEERRALAIYCGHADAVKAAMSVGEQARFWAQLYGAPHARADAALDALGVSRLARARASDLSAGQRRRLALARVIIAEKPVWLLDEPTASMDAAGAALLVALIDAHRRRGGAALIATHDLIALDGARALVIEGPESAP